MRYALVFILVIVCLSAEAQRKNEHWGYLRDSATGEPIALASVSNLNTHTTVVTSATGLFRIDIQQNHVLSFAAVGYHFDTLQFNDRFIDTDTLSLRLSPLSHNLGNVTVYSSGLSRYQLDSMERRKFFLGSMVDYTIPTVAKANSGAGIALNIDRFSRHEKNKRRAFAFFDASEKEEYINYRFPSTLVVSYSGLKGEQLQQFMQQYRPGAEWLRKNLSEEDLKYYINDKLKLFFRR